MTDMNSILLGVARYNNLTLSFSSAEVAAQSSSDGRDQLLLLMSGRAENIMLLCSKRNLAEERIDSRDPSLTRIKDLVSTIVEIGEYPSLYSVPFPSIQLCREEYLEGVLRYRETVNGGQGAERILSTGFGSFVIEVGVPELLKCLHEHSSSSSPSIQLSVLKNHYSCFRQNQVKVMKKLLQRNSQSLFVIWPVQKTLVLLGNVAHLQECADYILKQSSG